VNIPDLPPDIRFHLLTRSAEAFENSFEAKRTALGPYIVQRWGWDETFQRNAHRERFDTKPFFGITHDGRQVGTLSLEEFETYIRFGEFYLLPERQKMGLGSRILRHCVGRADESGLPVRLEYLKWNPVGTLYSRHGFVVVGETDIHWLMERRSAPA